VTFPPAVTGFWRDQLERGDVLRQGAGFSLRLVPDLPRDWRAQVLERADGTAEVTVSPELASATGLLDEPSADLDGFRARLAGGGFALLGADRLFYVATSDRPRVLSEAEHSPARALSPRDATAFSRFVGSASERDLDDAYVELDHWAAVGVFEEDRLVCAASAYPWQGSTLADIGVLTLAPARGKGYGRAAVQALCAIADDRGYDPQYRCQPRNLASAAVALAAGFTELGTWQVAIDAPGGR